LVNSFRLDIAFKTTYGNPGSQKKHSIHGYYPDVMIEAEENKWWLVEVKTTTQVTKSMLPQLEKYLTVGERVWIVVPEPLLEKAKTICRPLRGIRFGTWKPGLLGAEVHLQGI
jgi:hypothetical protein